MALARKRGVERSLVIEVQHQRMRRRFRRHTRRRGLAQRQRARTRLDQQRIRMAVVAAFKLDDLGAPRKPARYAYRAHRGFGT